LSKAVRLLGLHASGFLERSRNATQLSFELDASTFDAKVEAASISRRRQLDNEALRDAVDDVRRRFGRTSLGVVSELHDEGVDIATQRGRHAFGPEG
jgi:hypothetical protein